MRVQIQSTRIVWNAFALTTLAWAGCGRTEAVVEGKVLQQGQPVSSAEVVLAALENPGEQFFGVTGEDGSLFLTYRTAEGLLPGRYAIHITRFTGRNGQPLPTGEEGAVLRQSGDARTQTYAFEKELTAGVNVLELKLEEALPEQPLPGGA